LRNNIYFFKYYGVFQDTILKSYAFAIQNIKKAQELNPNHPKALNLLNQLNRIQK